jgi:hypothetical protein
MRFLTRFMLVALVAGLIFTAVPRAYAFTAEGEASIDVLSTYVWRGQNLGSNEIVIQPAIGFSAGGFGMGLWSSYDSEMGEHVETDLTLSYGRSLGIVSLEAGYIYYALDTIQDTSEVYFSIGVDTILSPSLTYYEDIDKGEGGFLVASVGHSFTLPAELSLDLGLNASYCFDNAIMGTDSEGKNIEDFYNAEFTVGLNIPVGESITITPKMAYTTALSHDAEDAIKGANLDDGDSDIFYGGVGVSFSF